MKDRILASRYARALLATLPDARAAESADEFLTAVAEAMRQSAELRDVMLNPAVSRSTRKALLTALARNHRMPRQVSNFLCIVADHGRTGALPTIARVFHEEKEEALGIVAVALRSAVPLSRDLQERARAAFEKLTQRKVRLDCSVDPSLVGGAVTRVGSTIYDGTLETQLRVLGRRMSGE